MGDSMKIRFQRVKTKLGFLNKMSLFINHAFIYDLKNGEVFTYESSDIKTILIQAKPFVKDLIIPVDNFNESVDILLQFKIKLFNNYIHAIVSENGKLVGTYPIEAIN